MIESHKADTSPPWYQPIWERVEKLENDCDLFEDIAEGLADDGPDFVWKCLFSSVTPIRKNFGMDRFRDGIDTKRVGAVVGCKVSLCDGMANTHRLFEMFSAKQLKEIEDAWGSEALVYARKVWKRFAEKFKPQADELRRFALELVRDRGVEEEIKYMMGYVNGARMIAEVGKRFRSLMKKDRSKRERDFVAHNAVLMFAVTNWKWIEENRRKLTWMKLTEMFDKETNNEIDIDEETFKKILQRASLTVGKSSKPMSKGRSRTSA